ncbi:deoxyguanosinetriphosphate triphosphohydrolase [Gordonibacter urolithinfaciens]|uniref:Deoxyguanosinetriphosphate triphosphohydrolase-like protein n=1 Tax=Gordonibacter urolithinfaciens TaxID=1335613 RepID=A0A6N8IPK2_9ACTN|nr:deoxyguanosinetriphosphate triphosphohydrolase [Gordonibacter urolithinfaciens]MVM56303.1 deoxyguanosinetriphosphate triphosphohydrolase [Gordonibacter urolithinfaciens]MVN16823.1 deoxyguanosinetriphosphate triphosphohydrolase [Gordonibacter urolithinfaciens]MVN40273.1 deoxyguanosinetriphosphate triphosphohydrolase [Gordonibacter urolithinfaciens]MVN57500.1 deoxyguanosinetriphosphate triphosphohydrolase [Gordonibacter urolithinfaciens]MVN62929.1 deoxyguanosinetriphosphate triphosphohydrolas
MRIIHREDQEEHAHEALSPDASFADESEGRARSAEPDILRNDYQRDRDKILHTKSFRRLSHKTQVFLAAEGDHFRTRLTHTLEVAQIARTIARALGLNEDLTEAISLGHDLGHTPFGHTGEEALARSIARHRGVDPASPEAEALYRHNEQSLRVVERIENGGKGLNLTPEVRDGILNHTGDLRAETLEGRIVGTADRIAYVNHDIDDAIRAGILSEGDLPDTTHAVLGPDHSSRIQTLVMDMVETSAACDDIRMSDSVWDAMMELRAFLFARVYTAPVVMAEVDKATRLVGALFDYYVAHTEEVPEEYRAIAEGDDLRAVTDYVAGMTDRFAKNLFQQLFIPHSVHY